MKTFVIVNLETMGIFINSAIISIGAQVCTWENLKEGESNNFYSKINWKGQRGRIIYPNAKLWWGQQSKEAQECLDGKEDIYFALKGFSEWFPKDVVVWSKRGATSILQHAFDQYDLPLPASWNFQNTADTRTVQLLYESFFPHIEIPFDGIRHNALHGAQQEAKLLSHWYKKMEENIFASKECVEQFTEIQKNTKKLETENEQLKKENKDLKDDYWDMRVEIRNACEERNSIEELETKYERSRD